MNKGFYILWLVVSLLDFVPAFFCSYWLWQSGNKYAREQAVLLFGVGLEACVVFLRVVFATQQPQPASMAWGAAVLSARTAKSLIVHRYFYRLLIKRAPSPTHVDKQ